MGILSAYTCKERSKDEITHHDEIYDEKYQILLFDFFLSSLV